MRGQPAPAPRLASFLRRELIQQVVMALTQDTRRTLAERIERKVAGRGISRAAIEAAVDDVLAALPSPPEPGVGEAPALVGAFASPTAPDLGSRVRRVLEGEGVVLLGLGSATSGRHTVVTVRVPQAARAALERTAAQLSLPLSLLPDGTGA